VRWLISCNGSQREVYTVVKVCNVGVILEPFDLYCFTDPPSDYGDLDMEELRIY